jgi:anti-sigma factor RsiW
MHKHILELLPFYINRTLSDSDAEDVRKHLTQCAACRKAFVEWQRIAGEVVQSGEAWAQPLPALKTNIPPRVRPSLEPRFHISAVLLTAVFVTVLAALLLALQYQKFI